MIKYIKIILSFIFILIIAFVISRLFGFKSYRYSQSANSMYPTISPGDIWLCKMGKYHEADEIVRGKAILFKHVNFDYFLTKRVIAIEGDVVEIKNDSLFLNNSYIKEPYAFFSDTKFTSHSTTNIDSLIVGKNKIFVMGDNRNNSTDSRTPEFGLINIHDVVGRPLVILWSNDKSRIFSTL